MTPTWIENDDGSLRCTACGIASFRPGHHCRCLAGGSSVTPELGRPLESSASSEISAGEPSARSLPSVSDCEAHLSWVFDEQRRLLQRWKTARTRDKMGGQGEWQKWDAVHSRLRGQNKTLEEMTKTACRQLEAARARGEVELVERMERAVAELRRRRGRLSQEPGVQ